jgi:predicted transposase/invertase (TIGR01784 family)
LNPKDIKKIEIINPINLSEDVSGKEFILDIHVFLNDNTLINLEMQVGNEYNWPDRSLSYACRAYDNLQKGQEYEDVLPVIHIGFLDYTPFPEVPEFYSKYVMTNLKNNHVYSDKFVLRVVNLKRIDLATVEDKAFAIDYWARLFKAETWEELKMLTENNEYLQEAAESLYVANADEIVRQQCRAREDAERRERTILRDKKILADQLAKTQMALDEALAQKKEAIAQKDEVLAQKDEYIAYLEAQLSKKK